MAEVKRLLDATRCLKHQAALSVAYGAGLRVAEVSALKVTDIDSKRMLLRIERGKGDRYRNAMLPEGLLLRDWWRAGRPDDRRLRRRSLSRRFSASIRATHRSGSPIFHGPAGSCLHRQPFHRPAARDLARAAGLDASPWPNSDPASSGNTC
ncbi:integrase [Sphingopyxis panaciterrae]|nr:integrase [Sphingopyxis panaciterrae]